MDIFGNNSMIAPNNFLLQSITSSAQELNYNPILNSMTTSIINSAVNGGNGVINPTFSANPTFSLSSTLPDLRMAKEKLLASQTSPNHSSLQIKYEPATSPCRSNNIGANKSNEDAEGVWSPDIEMAFQEALEAYPPCGRRKIILTDEGKMYGRNELIARYIKEKTGKSRTRKQVSSHIQVLARKKSKELQQQIKDSETRDRLLQQYSAMSSAQIVNEVMKEKKLRTDINGSSPVHHSPLYSTVPFKHEIKSECANSPPGIPVTVMNNNDTTTTAVTGPHGIPNLQLIKSELDDGSRHGLPAHQKYRANNLIVTTADTINTYFSTSNLQAMALPRTLSSMVDSPAFGITAHQRTLHQSPDSTHNGNSTNPLPQPRFKLLKFNGYMESVDKSWRHYFIDLNCTETEFSDPCLESIKIDNIHDKFKEFTSGNGVHEPTLKELFKIGPRSAFFVVKFWVNLNMPRRDANRSTNTFHGHDNVWESREQLKIKVSTKACSFGKGVVEKVQKVDPRPHNGSYLYEVDKSPLCEYMINFIDKLKDLPATTLMNNVLENFTVMQHIIDLDSLETLLCIACMFEVSDSNHPDYSIYRLTD